MAHSLDPIIDKIVIARVGLLLRHPFFGNMATRMKLVDASDWLPTAATDFRNFYFNREFFEKMTPRQVEFVVAHEILHCVFDHMMRVEGRDRKIWNIAADYCVNGILKRDRIGDDPPVKFFHDRKYDGWSAEQVYDEISNKYDDEELDQLGQLLDEHMDGQGDGEGDKDGKGKGQPSYSKEELKQIRDEIKEAMIQAAQAAGAGNVPGEIGRMIRDLTEPKMNWREMLRQQIQSTVKSDFSFSRPSRKGQMTGAILPGSNFDTAIDVCVAIDMSGSISDAQAQDFMSEIKGIMQEFKEFQIKVWCFDTKVYNEQDFDSYTADDIDDYEVMGGGGTEFDVNWDYMKQHNINPKKFIMFTDGYPWGSWGDEDYCDTIFIIHGNDTIVPPWGEHAYYDSPSSN
jgi:predicted metal-dependent peptidase